MMKKYAIIVAGGTGQRMQAELPKQMLPVHGKAIIIHTIEKFLAYDAAIHLIVAIHESLEGTLLNLLRQQGIQNRVQLVPGGKTRFGSVKNALEAIGGEGVVGIHDAARPLVSIDTIARCYAAAVRNGNAIPVVAMNESLREIKPGGSTAADRNRYKIVQTPQCFDVALIKKAFEQQDSPAFTDDATVLESAGGHIHLVEGNPENIKITYPADLKIAALFLQ